MSEQVVVRPGPPVEEKPARAAAVGLKTTTTATTTTATTAAETQQQRAATAAAEPNKSGFLDIVRPYIPIIVIVIVLFILVIWFLSTPLGQALSAAIGAIAGLVTAAAAWLTNCLGTWWCPFLVALIGIGAIFLYSSFKATQDGGDKIAREGKLTEQKENANEQAEDAGREKPFNNSDIPTEQEQAQAGIDKYNATKNIADNPVAKETQAALQSTAQQDLKASTQAAGDPDVDPEEKEGLVDDADASNGAESAFDGAHADAKFSALPPAVQAAIDTVMIAHVRQLYAERRRIYRTTGVALALPQLHWSMYLQPALTSLGIAAPQQQQQQQQQQIQQQTR